MQGGTAGVGYLLKQRIAAVETFLVDLERIVAGASVIDPELVASLLTSRSAESVLDRLTPRQREVLALMAEGRSNAAIGASLQLSEKAIVHHVSRLYETLGLPPSPDDHRRVLAVLRYLSLRA